MPHSRVTRTTITSTALFLYRGANVVTMAAIDAAHGRPAGTARRNFNYNKEWFIEEKDYFVADPKEVRSINPDAISQMTRKPITLMTFRGYLLLAKCFRDALAIEVRENVWVDRERLVDAYLHEKRASPSRWQADVNDPTAVRDVLKAFAVWEASLAFCLDSLPV